VDCSGQPKTPPMIAVATRWSRRNIQQKYIIRATKKKISSYRKRYSDWQEKLYAALFFKVINGPNILRSGFEIHIDKELPNTQTQNKVLSYLLRLFGMIYSGEIDKQRPEIHFLTDKSSEYVKHADKKTRLARKGKIRINEKEAALDYLMKLL